MKICFSAAEPEEEAFFRDELGELEPRFADSLEDVPSDTEVLSIFIYDVIDEEVLLKLPELKLIATRSTGVDHIDLDACAAHGVEVAHVTSYGENTVAEHTFALMLALTRRLNDCTEASRKRHYRHSALRGFDLRGRTLGVLGGGRIGLRVAQLGAAFGMRSLVYDTRPQQLLSETLNFTYEPLDKVFGEAHILTLHLPLNESTHHIINEKSLNECRHGVVIINTARGGLIDTSALARALDSGQVRGAGLDVLEEERVFRRDAASIIGEQIYERVHSHGRESESKLSPKDAARLEEFRKLVRHSALLSRPNVVFTPHVAFNSEEALEALNRSTLENIRAFLEQSRQTAGA